MTNLRPSFSSIPNSVDWDQDWFNRWLQEIQWPEDGQKHRKAWEFCVILETLERAGMLKYHKRGLGFGVGNEPLASVLAKYKVSVLATDYDPESAKKDGWSDVHVGGAFRTEGVIDQKTFDQYVKYREVNMNKVPADLDGQFDFVWSSCSLEHLGGRYNGMQFVIRAMHCLKPGGLAVHTTEYTWGKGFDAHNLATFSGTDLTNLQKYLADRGFEMETLNFTSGDTPADTYVSQPPHKTVQPHLRLDIMGEKATSCLLIIRRPPNS